jgi:hypothetical protein
VISVHVVHPKDVSTQSGGSFVVLTVKGREVCFRPAAQTDDIAQLRSRFVQWVSYAQAKPQHEISVPDQYADRQVEFCDIKRFLFIAFVCAHHLFSFSNSLSFRLFVFAHHFVFFLFVAFVCTHHFVFFFSFPRSPRSRLSPRFGAKSNAKVEEATTMGWLYRKFGVEWKKRFFTLKGTTITYYADENISTLGLGFADLKLVSKVETKVTTI